jgi:hypothetical protein
MGGFTFVRTKKRGSAENRRRNRNPN